MAAKPVAAWSRCIAAVGRRRLARRSTRAGAAAGRYGVAIAGGDTNSWDGPLAISITAIGRRHRAGRFCAAAPTWRSNHRHREFGGSILGKHLDFEPRIEEALLLNERYKLRRRHGLQRRPVARPVAIDGGKFAAAR